MSLKFDKARKLFLLKYINTPAHQHTAAEIVELAKLDYASKIGRNDNTDNVNQEEDSIAEESNVENSSGNNQALRVHATSRPVTLNIPPRVTPTPEVPINDDQEEPVHILVEDDGYVFSDHESPNHEDGDGDDEVVDDRADRRRSREQLDTYNGVGEMSAGQIARIHEVINSLLYDPRRFAHVADTEEFQQKLEGLLYYARRLNNRSAN
ncbi:unnamed protein product [Ambrosiozyma monospora]|uniref:Unnamed protein product n=1 Tax=Ambrosiozyma monospora TaxID=43982 RepID=A0ACB5U876_AMBMO|nr:unnamed protein product [Ambrosiozyma monospora]